MRQSIRVRSASGKSPPLPPAAIWLTLRRTGKGGDMHVLVTGAAGFNGYHLARRLLADGHTVVGNDNCNDY